MAQENREAEVISAKSQNTEINVSEYSKVVLEAELVEEDNLDEIGEEEDENENEYDTGGVIFFTPKETAEKLNIPVDLLRNYYIKEFENEPYLKPHIYKGKGKRRKYSEEAIKILSNIVKMKNIDGYSFSQIKEILNREGSNRLPETATNMVIVSQKEIIENMNKMVSTVKMIADNLDKKGVTKEELSKQIMFANDNLMEQMEDKIAEAVQKGIEAGRKKGVKQYRSVYEKKLSLFQRFGARLFRIPVYDNKDEEDDEELTVDEGN